MDKEMDLTAYKGILVGVLDYIDAVCRKHKIQYFIAFGTLLGAVRHKGYIPWDDDVDIMMDRSNFQRFVEVMRQENDSVYKLMWLTEQDDYDLPLPKVVDTRIRLQQKHRKSNLTLGAWVDVFIFDDLHDNSKTQKRICRRFDIREKIWNYSQYDTFNWKNTTSLGSKARWLFYSTLALPGSRFWAKVMNKRAMRKRKKTDFFAPLVFFSAKRMTFEKAWFGDGVELEFEGKYYYAPENWDAVLTHRYGDYMTLPPEEQRVRAHGIVVTYQEALVDNA